MSRHRAPDSDDETTFIPKIVDSDPPPAKPVKPRKTAAPRATPAAADDVTTVRLTSDNDATTLIPKIVEPLADPSPAPVVALPPILPLDADATTTIPRIMADDATTTIPRITAEDSETTMLIGIVPPLPTDPAPPPRRPRPGEPPVRAVRTKTPGDYLSAHSDYTRVTVGSVIRTTLRTAGELLITCGLVLLLFASYEVWGKTAIVDAHQAQLNDQLISEWDKPLPTQNTIKNPLPPPPGDVIGRLYLPRLNKHWVITQGVTQADIRYSPGHYPNTAMPGQPGNFAMAGHRMLSVFWDLDKLQEGDKIIVETRTTWYVYAVVRSRVVRPYQVEVVSPTPPGVTPGKLVTLTTCNPKWNNYERLIIHGTLIREQSRADGAPVELGG